MALPEDLGIEDEDDTDMIEDPEELEIEESEATSPTAHRERPSAHLNHPPGFLRTGLLQVELDEMGHDVSAFNTADYQRTHAPFSLYHWQLEKLCEKVKHMAIDFSIIKDETGKDEHQNKSLAIHQYQRTSA